MAGPASRLWIGDTRGRVDPNLVPITADKAWKDVLTRYSVDHSVEGAAQAPVIETHSYTPRTDVDGSNWLMLHSFVAVRYTELDDRTKLYRRKRAVIGFCGDGLRNDINNPADMSSETPISVSQFNSAMDAIDTGGKTPYSLPNFNCNHFSVEVAKAAGATVPQKLHDSIFGPMAAYRNLANAAAEPQTGTTRFFQGGSTSKGQMSQENRTNFLDDFFDLSKQAARRDGLPFFFHRGLKSTAESTAQAAQALSTQFKGIPSRADEGALASGGEEQTVRQVTQTATDKAQELIHYSSFKGHPRVNMAAMKVVAMAEQLRSLLLPDEKQSITSYTDDQIATAMTFNEITLSADQQADAERSDEGKRKAFAIRLRRNDMSTLGTMLLASLGVPLSTRLTDSQRGVNGILYSVMNQLSRSSSTEITPFLVKVKETYPTMSDRELSLLCCTAITDGILNHFSDGRAVSSLYSESADSNNRSDARQAHFASSTHGSVSYYNKLRAGKEITYTPVHLMQAVMLSRFTNLSSQNQTQSPVASSEEEIRGEEGD